MERETLEKAISLRDDLEVMQRIKYAMETGYDGQWGFSTPYYARLNGGAGLILPNSFKPKLGKLVIEHIEDIENQLREL